MDAFPAPAAAMVERMRDAARSDPAAAIAFQGAPGANSHRAIMEYAPEALALPCPGFADALEAVKDGRAGAAMIPIENSHNGRVADIHFLLPESGLAIVDEHFMAISHALVAMSDGPFKIAYSHPQAIGQSRAYLRAKGITGLSHADTAGAAAYVAERGDPDIAALAPAMTAELYGLKVIEEHVEDARDNTTRFVVLAREPRDPAAIEERDVMTTFIFTVKNVPAALYKALGGFATNGVNMTKLESYQQGTSFSASTFYADIIGGPGDPAVDRAMEELAFHCRELRILGTYPIARERG